MSMFVKKNPWQILKEEQKTVNRARQDYRDCVNDFRCLEPKNNVNDEVVIDNEGTAHIVIVQDVAMPMTCVIFHKDKKCEKELCQHKKWNTKIVKSYVMLKNARYERNLAIWNLFGLKERVIDIRAYHKLKRERDAKSKEVFSLFFEYAVAEGATEVQMRKKYESALQDYDALVTKCKVARSKAFGRGK